MKCDRCGSEMVEEQVCVTGGLVKIKNVSAWHCTNCGRVEYLSTESPSRQQMKLQFST